MTPPAELLSCTEYCRLSLRHEIDKGHITTNMVRYITVCFLVDDNELNNIYLYKIILAVSAAYTHAFILGPPDMLSIPLRKLAIWHSVFLGLIAIGFSVESAMKKRVCRKRWILNNMVQLRTDLEVILRWFENGQGGERGQESRGRRDTSFFHSIGAVTIYGQPTFIMVNEVTFLDPSSDNIRREVRLERAEKLLRDILRYRWARSQTDKIHEILEIIHGLSVVN